MKGIKMTPTLARALAERAVEQINAARKAENEVLEEEIKARKDFKRLAEIDIEIARLDAEKDKVIRMIKAEYHPKISNISKPGYYGQPNKNEYNISFNDPWVSSEVIKNQILLEGTFTNDSVDSIIDGIVAGSLQKK